MDTKQYLEIFFAEKEIPFAQWEIEENGQQHIIDNEFVINLIKDATESEQEQIATTLRKIDWYNGDVNDFLKHLAVSFIKTHY
jgi:hypothetical protein